MLEIINSNIDFFFYFSISGQPIFPGESEVDQLYIIQKIIGPLIPEHLDIFMQNPRFSGLKFPDMSKPETLQKKYMGKFTKTAMHFMKSLLCMDPDLRPNTMATLNSPYFEEFHNRNQQGNSSSSSSSTTIQYQQQSQLSNFNHLSAQSDNKRGCMFVCYLYYTVLFFFYITYLLLFEYFPFILIHRYGSTTSSYNIPISKR